jgi:hypothetical protein
VPALPAALRRRLDKLADNWIENVVRDLAHGGEIGDWQDDAKATWEQHDQAYGYLMDRFADWSALVGAIIRTRRTP